MAARAWQNGRNRSFTLAVLVAFGLRLAWAVWATQSISNELTDSAQYLAYAERFSGLGAPQIYGESTAFLPPGYPLFLAPLAFIARNTGAISVNFLASLANVALGTATVVFTSLLAQRWIGPAARNPAAWLMAMAAGHVYYTSVVLSETLFATLTTGLLLAATALAWNGRERSARWLVAFGALVGLAMLVRTPGAILLFAPAMVLRATAGSWRGALKTTGWVLLGSLVLIVPWTIRNAVQVGVAVPISTNNAAFLCGGHSEYATGGFDQTPEALQLCYGGGPYDPREADEPRWYRETTADALSWAVRHPVDEVRLTLWKTYLTMGDDTEALSDAEDFGAQPLASERWQAVLRSVANAWHWGVIAMAAAGLLWVPACRRAGPIWVTAAANLVAVWGGLALPRYHHAIMPLLVVFAAGAIATLARSSSAVEVAEGVAP